MATMKLYQQEEKDIILRTQNHDPFMDYLTSKIMPPLEERKIKGRVLDLGCGSGRNVFAAVERGYTGVGVDNVKTSLEIANEEAKRLRIAKKATFIHADITKLKKQQFGVFDFVILQEVIEHVPDFQKLIDFSYGSLKKGGMILITTPNDPNQWTVFDDYARHVRRFKIPELALSLKSFKNVSISTVGFPLHRLTLKTYDIATKILGTTHEAKRFRKNSEFHNVYYLFGSFVMKIDDLFTTPWGDTLVAMGEK